MNRRYYTIAALVMVALLLIGLRWPHISNSLQNIANHPTPIKVGLKWAHQGQFAGYYVATEKGWYTNSRLRVTLREHQAGQDTAAQVAAGELQFGIVGVQDALRTYASTNNITAVAAIYQKSPSIIVTRSDSNITSLSDLRGKTIAVESDDLTGQQLLYQTLLQQAKVPINNILFVAVGHNQVAALINKQVDAAIIYRNQELYELQRFLPQYRSFKPEDFGVNTYNDVLIVNNQWLAAHPEAARRFIQNTLAGWQYTTNHVSEAIDITLQYATGKYQDRDYQRFTIEQSLPLIIPAGGEPIGHMSLERWQNSYDQLRQTLMIPSYDLQDLFTNDYIWNPQP